MKNSYLIPFFDIILNLLLAISFILLLAILIINPTKTQNDGNIVKKAEYMIIMEWDKDTDSDIDLWVMDPDGKIAFFSNKDIGGLHLERDDLGSASDVITINGEEQENPENQEVVVIRQLKPGIYHVNIHFYNDFRSDKSVPVAVTISVVGLNPSYKLLSKKVVELESVSKKAEVFSLEATDKKIIEVHDYAKIFVGDQE